MKGNVSVFCQDVIGFDDEHEKKKHCLGSASRIRDCLPVDISDCDHKVDINFSIQFFNLIDKYNNTLVLLS